MCCFCFWTERLGAERGPRLSVLDRSDPRASGPPFLQAERAKSKRRTEGPGRGRGADFLPGENRGKSGKVIACHCHRTTKISKASEISKSFSEREGNVPRPDHASVPLDGRPALGFGGVVGGRHDRCVEDHPCSPCPVDTRRRRRPLPEAAPHRGQDEPPNVDLGEHGGDAAPREEDAGRRRRRLQLQAGPSRASCARGLMIHPWVFS